MGYGTHICNITQGLKGSEKLKPRALNLYVGNGHRATVEAIVNFHLCLLSGLVIILNNCHYAPSITRGIILVSCLKDNGSVNYFCDNGISISKDGLLYFQVIPCDGIYEINLHCAYSNDSSIYAVSNKRFKLNLDSTLLWHCHLGYIIKNRIKKLQHDRLLKSTDHESFDKCVSCMFGKTTCKPYLQQVERAKDLLRLIHTDVCGLFRIVLRQGLSYSVTFTDEFSRYGYVYLLKHKHEVFETFKVFQKEVENQLGKTIKALRYDRRVDLPPNGETVGSKWFYKKKTDMDGNVHTCKARLVAKDFAQTYKVDYKKTFSPVVDIRAIRILIAIIAYYDYEIWQMAVKTTFLNVHLSKEVYMVQPKGFFDPKHPNQMLMTQSLRYVFVLNGTDVDWKITKQSFLATSSTEAEYIAASNASKEKVRIRKFIYGIVLFPQIKLGRIHLYAYSIEANLNALDMLRIIGISSNNGVLLDAFQCWYKVTCYAKSQVGVVGLWSLLYFEINNFTTSATNIVLLLGDAIYSDGTIEFNKVDNHKYCVGHAIYADAVQIWDSRSGKLSDFTSHFSFIIDTLGNSTYCCGFTFFIRHAGDEIIPNSGGTFLGLFNTSSRDDYDSQIIHVEFDSTSNTWDPPSEHVAINKNSLRSVNYTAWNASLHSGDPAEAWIFYNATTQMR
nr:retrotransposon protein, putative, Ty1-copia subclass [Tanacetum cinerariifolium]